MNKLDKYTLNENFSWTFFLSWTFLVALKYIIIVKQILKSIAEEKEPTNAKVQFDLSKKISTIVGENVRILWFASTEMKTFVLREDLYYSSALENELTEDEIVALLLYEFNAKKKNLKTKENISGHLKFGLPFEIFVALLYGICPSLVNWFVVLNVAIPVFLDRKYMEYIKKLNTFSGDTYVTNLGYGPHLLSALTKIRTFQRKKLRASVKNVEDIEKTLNKISLSKLEPVFSERIKNLVDAIAKSQTVLTTNVLYKKMKDLLDSSLIKKNGEPKSEEPLKPTEPVIIDIEALPKKEADKIKTKNEKDELYAKIVEFAKTNPELRAEDLQINFKITLSQAFKYYKKLKEEKILDKKYKVVPKALVKHSTEKPKVEVPKAAPAPIKTETPKVTKPKVETPKVEKPKVEKPKPTTVKAPDVPKVTKKEEPKPEPVKTPEKKKELYLDQVEYEAIIDFIKTKKVINYEMIQRNFRISRTLSVEYVKQLQKDGFLSSTLRVINAEAEPTNVKTKEEIEAIEYKKVLEFAKSQIGVSVSILQKEFQISPTRAKELFNKLLKDGIVNKEGDVLTVATKINKITDADAKKNFNHADKVLAKLDKLIDEPTEDGEEESTDVGKYKSDRIEKMSKSELRKRLLNRGK